MGRVTARQIVIVAVLLSWYSVVGHRRVEDWSSELNLWTRATAISPLKPRPHINRAKALFGLGRVDEAVQEVYIAASMEEARGEH